MENGLGRRAVIVCGSNISLIPRLSRFFWGDPLIIVADGGAGLMRAAELKPYALVGDFDSILPDDLNYFRNMGVIIHKYKTEKDMTDSEIALNIALENSEEREITEIVLLSRSGGRLDHQLNNISMLEKVSNKGIKAMAADEDTEIIIATPELPVIIRRSIFVPHEPYISLIPVTETVLTGNCTGLKYDPSGIEFRRGASRGISNGFKEETAHINIIKGKLLVLATAFNEDT